MDNEKLNIIISLVVAIATFISTLYGIKSFKKQKEYEKYEVSFKEFYVPLLQLIEKHLYVSDINSSSFLSAKTSVHKLIEDKYIYVPFRIQNAFSDFESNNNEKNYKKFCDSFLTNYYEVSKVCGMKHITVWHRNKCKWYSSKLKFIFTNIKFWLDFIYLIFMGFSIWVISLAIIFSFLKWVGII